MIVSGFTFIEKLQKISAGNRKGSDDDSGLWSSGNELVLSCGAALCGRVGMRLVSNDHFWWNA